MQSCVLPDNRMSCPTDERFLSLFMVLYFVSFAFLTADAAAVLYNSKVFVLPEAGSE